MKTVIFVRHAKSSWDDSSLSDFERPLNKRGRRDAPFMANILSEKKIKPDLIISSPAERALTTCEIFADILNYPSENIKKDISIYRAGFSHILNIVPELENSINSIMIFGHNPDLTDVCEFYTNVVIDNVPTCGIVCINFEVDSWGKVTEGKGVISFFEYPKKYPHLSK